MDVKKGYFLNNSKYCNYKAFIISLWFLYNTAFS